MGDKMSKNNIKYNLFRMTIKRAKERADIVNNLLINAKYYIDKGNKYLTEAKRIMALTKKQ